MNKLLLGTAVLFSILFMTGCVNKHGISLKYYSDCKEYYDLQGYYHKECGEDDIITYKEIHQALKKKKEEPQKNVW